MFLFLKHYNPILCKLFFTLIVSCFCASCQRVEAEPLIPFALPWDDGEESITDVSHLLDPPAGKNGFIRVEDGRFVNEHGERVRFLGVNNSFSGNFPSKEDAPKIAARLAKFGVNSVRFHHMDTLRAPSGIWLEGVSDKQALDPDRLDRMDFFIHQLKEHGIYTNLNLKVGRKTVDADGVPYANQLPTYDKGPDHYFPRLVELQKDFARDLLTHRNPYTGLRYIEDPAIAIIEINNESGLVGQWSNSALDSLPDVLIDPLRERWNQYLIEHYDDSETLAEAWSSGIEASGEEMLTRNLGGWLLQTLEQARGQMRTTEDGPDDESARRITVTQTGGADWHIQAVYPNLSFEQGKVYRLTLWMRASPTRTVRVGLRQNHDPWQFLDSDIPVTVTAQWKPFEFYFTSSEDNDNARLDLTNLGGQLGDIWIARPSMIEEAPSGLPDGQRLEDGSVDWFSRERFAIYSTPARMDWMRFLIEVETDYNREMYDYIRNELGGRALITGSQMSFSTLISQLGHDFIDNHAYWQHPAFPGRPWDSANWTVQNLSIVNEINNPLLGMMQDRIDGMPYTVSEYNHPAPITYSSECVPLLAAYAAFQDWDGIYYYSYSHNDDHRAKSINSFFDIVGHTPKMMAMPFAANLYLRGDLATSDEKVVGVLSPENYIERVAERGGNLWFRHLPQTDAHPHAPYLYRSAVRITDDPAPVDNPEVSVSLAKETVTGELEWRTRGSLSYVTISAPRSKGLIGFDPRRAVNLGDGVELEIGETKQNWANALLTWIRDDEEGERWLLAATGYHENQGMRWNAEMTSVGTNWGAGPPLVERIPLRLRFADKNKPAQVFILDERGHRVEEVTDAARVENDGVVIDLMKPPAALWYEIVFDTSSRVETSWLHGND